MKTTSKLAGTVTDDGKPKVGLGRDPAAMLLGVLEESGHCNLRAPSQHHHSAEEQCELKKPVATNLKKIEPAAGPPGADGSKAMTKGGHCGPDADDECEWASVESSEPETVASEEYAQLAEAGMRVRFPDGERGQVVGAERKRDFYQLRVLLEGGLDLPLNPAEVRAFEDCEDSQF